VTHAFSNKFMIIEILRANLDLIEDTNTLRKRLVKTRDRTRLCIDEIMEDDLSKYVDEVSR
jgi:hypothetical protein